MRNASRSPTIADFMTPSPHSVAVDRSLEDAHRLMRHHKIRHLPVLEGGRLVGIVTERDLALLELRGNVLARDVEVEEAMSPEVFVVAPDASLLEVSLQMWKHKWGSVVVMEDREVVGVFTTVDAMRALATLLAGPRRRAAAAVKAKTKAAKATDTRRTTRKRA